MPDSLLPTGRQHLEVSPEFTPRPKVHYKPVSEFDGRRRNNMSPEQRTRAGHLGGMEVAKNRAHMAEIGRRGGLAVSSNVDHMRVIGAMGGRASTKKNPPTPTI